MRVQRPTPGGGKRYVKETLLEKVKTLVRSYDAARAERENVRDALTCEKCEFNNPPEAAKRSWACDTCENGSHFKAKKEG